MHSTNQGWRNICKLFYNKTHKKENEEWVPCGDDEAQQLHEERHTKNHELDFVNADHELAEDSKELRTRRYDEVGFKKDNELNDDAWFIA